MSSRALVSWVANATSTETRHCAVSEVLNAIRTGARQREVIEAIRKRFKSELAQHGDYKKTKLAIDPLKEALRGILWSGQCSRRDNASLLKHSGLLCADLDDLGPELPRVRERLRKSPHLFALFLSPTGNGLKAVFRVPADGAKHARSFRAVQKHVRDLTGVQIDQKCKDPARLLHVVRPSALRQRECD